MGNIFSADPKHLRFLSVKVIPAKAFKEASEEYPKITPEKNIGFGKAPFSDEFKEKLLNIMEK
jgi:hypothetical protein